MIQKKQIFDLIKEFIINKIDNFDFALIFGSQALNNDFINSDIDFKIFLSTEATHKQRQLTGKFAQELHQKYCGISKLSSSDVPYEIKTIVNKRTLENSLMLKPFINTEGNLYIPEISFSNNFLLSEDCQMRTILSSLTTPNILIAGDPDLFEMIKMKAFKSIKNLICSVYNINAHNHNQIIQLLLRSPNGNSYKNHLGYKDSPYIRDYLLKYISNEYI